MKKLYLLVVVLLCGIMISCAKTEGEGLEIEGKIIRLIKAESNEEMQIMKNTYSIVGKGYSAQELLNCFFSENLSTIEVLETREDEIIVSETKFYKSIDEIWNFQYQKNQQWEVYRFDEIPVEDIPAVTFLTEKAGAQIRTIITPYAASVDCEENWMQEREPYQVIAVMEDGKQQEIFMLPFNKQKKMQEKEQKTLPYLADGFTIGQEIRNDNNVATGGKIIFASEIDIEHIKQIEIN